MKSDHLLLVTRTLLLLCSIATLAGAAEPRVELEVVTEQALVGTDARAWSELLSKAGFSTVRIRSGDGESPSIQTGGKADSPTYRVRGVITNANQLLLSRGRFGLSDRGAIEEWVRKLKDGGEDAIHIKPVAFGLLPKQLVAVHEALAVPVQGPTKGKQPRQVAKQIADQLTLKFITDAAGQQALATEGPVADELAGLSSGTAMAAVLRPLGLVMFPERQGAEIRLRITGSRSAQEHWPVGWPPKGNPSETLPELFRFLTVEINQTPLAETLSAIGERVKVPLLLDHNALARGNVDLATKVGLPMASTFYGRALDRLLAQAKLKYDLRIDEAGKPFLWITTLQQ